MFSWLMKQVEGRELVFCQRCGGTGVLGNDPYLVEFCPNCESGLKATDGQRIGDRAARRLRKLFDSQAN